MKENPTSKKALISYFNINYHIEKRFKDVNII